MHVEPVFGPCGPCKIEKQIEVELPMHLDISNDRVVVELEACQFTGRYLCIHQNRISSRTATSLAFRTIA